MASSIITGTTYNELINARIEWQSVPDALTCTSTVTAKLYLFRTNTWYTGTPTSGTNCLSLQINGQTVSSGGGSITVPNNGTPVLACQGTLKVAHEPDGSKQIVISASGSIQITSVKSISCQGKAVLDTIECGSAVGLFACDTDFLTGRMGVSVKPLRSGLYHRLRLLHKQTLLQEQTVAGEDYAEFILTKAQREQVYRAVTDTDRATLTLHLDTYTDQACTAHLGQTHIATLTLKFPQNSYIAPQLQLKAVPWGVQLQDLFIQNKTGIAVTVTATGTYGATVSTELTVNGKAVTMTDGTYQSDLLTDTKEVVIKAVATDSRGFTSVREQRVTALPYKDPRVTVRVCSRCNANKKLDDDGCYLYVDASAEHTAIPVEDPQSGQTADCNPCSLYVRIKLVSADDYGKDQQIAQGGAMVTANGKVLDITKSYQVQVAACDRVGKEASTNFLITTAKVQCHEGNGFLALGKYAEAGEKGVDIAADWPVRIRGQLLLGDGEKPVSLEQYIKNIVNGG